MNIACTNLGKSNTIKSHYECPTDNGNSSISFGDVSFSVHIGSKIGPPVLVCCIENERGKLAI